MMRETNDASAKRKSGSESESGSADNPYNIIEVNNCDDCLAHVEKRGKPESSGVILGSVSQYEAAAAAADDNSSKQEPQNLQTYEQQRVSDAGAFNQLQQLYAKQDKKVQQLIAAIFKLAPYKKKYEMQYAENLQMQQKYNEKVAELNKMTEMQFSFCY